jgi:hypothetical protein
LAGGRDGTIWSGSLAGAALAGGLEKRCHPAFAGLGAELGGELVAGSCANATIDAANKPNAMQ